MGQRAPPGGEAARTPASCAAPCTSAKAAKSTLLKSSALAGGLVFQGAVIAAGLMTSAQPAQALICIGTQDNTTANATTASASDGGFTTSTACGLSAAATYANDVAIGASAFATGSGGGGYATAVGASSLSD